MKHCMIVQRLQHFRNDIGGRCSLPLALHAKAIVMRNFSLFLPAICFDASPWSGGALVKFNKDQYGEIDKDSED
jgi:hypothetical protein